MLRNWEYFIVFLCVKEYIIQAGFFGYVCNYHHAPLTHTDPQFEGHRLEKRTRMWNVLIGIVRYVNNNNKKMCDENLYIIYGLQGSLWVCSLLLDFEKLRQSLRSLHQNILLFFLCKQLGYISTHLSSS